MDLIGKNIDGFKFISILGEGGMGVVYKAYDTKLERLVAVKMLQPRTKQSYKVLSQFKKEARHQAKLIHPNIVMIHGLIEYDTFLGIVMEYVEGENLHDIILQKGKIEFQQAIHYLKQILLGVDYAHCKGFIHRDLKPSNIIVDKNGHVKIMDFGISKSLFDSNSVETPFSKVGTILYISPEQIRGEGASVSSDVYSIGCTVYEMLFGYPPFLGENDYAVMQAHLNQLPVQLSDIVYGIPVWLNNLVLKSLEKNPADRYKNCNEMLDEINRNMVYSYRQTPLAQTPPAKKVGRSYEAIRLFIVIILVAILIAVSYYIVKTVEFSQSEGPKADPKQEQPIEKFLR